MELLFRKPDPESERYMAEFCALMDELSCRAQDTGLLRDIVRRYNAREDAWLLIAQDKASGRLCGSLLGVLMDDYCGECRPILFIENVVTGRDFRRMGVGRAMFAEIERWAKEHRAHYIVLGSGMQRREAHAFYHAIGYEEIKGFKKHL